MPNSISSHRNQVILMLCAAAVVIGSLGPWANVWLLPVHGTSGDGRITLAVGVIAGLVAFLEFSRPTNKRYLYIIMAFLFTGAAFIGGNAWMKAQQIVDVSPLPASVSWGLPVLTVGASLGLIAALVQVGEINKSGATGSRLGLYRWQRHALLGGIAIATVFIVTLVAVLSFIGLAPAGAKDERSVGELFSQTIEMYCPNVPSSHCRNTAPNHVADVVAVSQHTRREIYSYMVDEMNPADFDSYRDAVWEAGRQLVMNSK